MEHLAGAVDRSLSAAAASPSDEWVGAVLQLESTRGVLHGNGPGGDL